MTNKIEFKDNWELIIFGFLFSTLLIIPLYEVFVVSYRTSELEERVLSCLNFDKSSDALRECIQDEFPE